ncbi:MAG: glycosyltransferase family 2 protein [Candidatus Acidiferrales bacterium]
MLFLLAVIHQSISDLRFSAERRERRCGERAGYKPTVAILISAFNEEAVIEGRVRNLLASHFPEDRMRILVGLDSPTDSTANALRNIRSPILEVHHFSERRGKLAVLRDLSERTDAEILVFTDAETNFDRECLQNLTRHFANPRVGVVGGELRVRDSQGKVPVEGLYWKYEQAIKHLENRFGCVLGAVGAVYAVRHSLFHIKRPTFAEDFQLPMEILFDGYRVVFDCEAVAFEDAAPTFSAEFRRRVRLGAADYQTLLHNPQFLNPLAGLPAVSYFSHKVLRWLGPILLAVILICSALLSFKAFYGCLFAIQILLYGLAIIGYEQKMRGRPTGISSLPLYFGAMNLALLFGLFRYITGRQKMAWEVTPRQPVQRPAHNSE